MAQPILLCDTKGMSKMCIRDSYKPIILIIAEKVKKKFLTSNSNGVIIMDERAVRLLRSRAEVLFSEPFLKSIRKPDFQPLGKLYPDFFHKFKRYAGDVYKRQG